MHDARPKGQWLSAEVFLATKPLDLSRLFDFEQTAARRLEWRSRRLQAKLYWAGAKLKECR